MQFTMSCHTVTHNTPGGPCGDGGLTGPASGEGTSEDTGPGSTSVDPKKLNTHVCYEVRRLWICMSMHTCM